MPPSDSDDWVLTMDTTTGKLLDKKPTRTRKRTERAQQMDETNERARERREKQQTKKKLAIEAKQSQVADDDDEFAFGPAADFIEPTYTGNDALDDENFEASRAKFLLRKLEYFLGEDLRPAWQRGELSLAELEETYKAAMGGNPAPAVATKDKGKGRAMEVDDGRPSNYDGIRFGQRIPADIDTSDDDDQRVDKPATKSVSRDKPAPTAARSKFPALTSTDSSTVLDGKVLFYPQNLPPDAQIHVPPTSATVPGSPPRKKRRHVLPPGSKPTTSQPHRPSGSLKISSFGPSKPPAAKKGSQRQPSRVADSLPTPKKPPHSRDVDRVPLPPPPPSQNPRKGTADAQHHDPLPTRENGGSQSKSDRKTMANRSLDRHPHPMPSNIHQQVAPPPGRRGDHPRHGEASGNPGRNPPARAGQAANMNNPHNPRAGQDANPHPNPRPRTPSDIDGEVELADMDEEGDAPTLVNMQGMPVDPGVAILHNGKATLASFALVTHPTVRFMRQRSKAKVISIGSYDWERGDPGEEVPSVDHIVTYNFSVASRKMGSNYPFLMEHILHVQIVVRTERSNIKRVLEQAVIRFFHFSSNPAYNQQRSQELLPNGFHQLSTRDGVIPFGDPYIREACRLTVFDGQNSLGIRYPNYFNPIPWRFLAFIGAITNNIIHAWRHGHYKREKLDVTQQLPVFRKYLKLLEEMHARQPNLLEQLCGSIHDEARAQYEQTLQNSPTPEPAVQWAPDTVERYVPRFAKRHSPTAVSSEDEGPGSNDGEEYDASNQGEQVHYQDPLPRDSRQPHPVPNRLVANRDNDRAGVPGPSQNWQPAGYESQSRGAGPSRQQYRRRVDSNNSDDLPAPERVGTGKGPRQSAGETGQDDFGVTVYRGGWSDERADRPHVGTFQAPKDVEAVEFPDEQEHDVGEGRN